MTDPLRTVLDRLGLGDFYEVLAANDVDSSAIDELTEVDLRELGLTLGQRKRFLRARATPCGLPPHGQRASLADGRAPVRERRQLTSMFCDLVGSTPMSLRLDPEDFSEIIRVFHDICAGIITRGSGYVARYQGDGVLACFGYPRAREDDAQSAARAALEIVANISELSTPDGEPLSVRVGIATGLAVVVGEFSASRIAVEQSIVGETLNLAAGLESVADPGEIIISEATRRLCGGMFEYEQRGEILLDGSPEPVTIYRLLGEGSAESRFDARTISGLNPFVGREQELDLLFARWTAARGGCGQIVHVCGEPGIGKSRLALALVERLSCEPAAIVKWNCAAHLANRALHPIVRDIEIRAGISRSLSAQARRAGIDALVAASPTLFSEDAVSLYDLLGIETETHSQLDAASRARRMYGILARWLVGMARDMPVLILVEDAHWADTATLDFLTMLIDRIARLKALLLLTHRPEFKPPWNSLQARRDDRAGPAGRLRRRAAPRRGRARSRSAAIRGAYDPQEGGRGSAVRRRTSAHGARRRAEPQTQPGIVRGADDPRDPSGLADGAARSTWPSQGTRADRQRHRPRFHRRHVAGHRARSSRH